MQCSRRGYPLDASEQELLFNELTPDRRRIAQFAVNTGLRDQDWTPPMLKRSVFVLPAEFVKGKRPRVVVLNDYAQAILEELRGQHPRYVFTSQRGHSRRRVKHVIASSWRSARVRAARKYCARFGVDAPDGFRRIRVHDLRHTYGRRLRAAGVGLEDRQDLLGHKRQEITTHYSAAEVGQLIEAANRVLSPSTTSSATLLRVAAALPARLRTRRLSPDNRARDAGHVGGLLGLGMRAIAKPASR